MENFSYRFEWNRPKIVAFCSISNGGQEQNFESIEYLQYLHEPSWKKIDPKAALDLKAGFSKDTFRPKILCEKLCGFEAWYRHDPEKLLAALQTDKPVFLSFCGSFQTISLMRTPRKKEWTMYATKYGNLIFLCEKKDRQMSRDGMAEYMGSKCEQYLLSDDPKEPPNTSAPIHSQKEFCLFNSNVLNGKELIYGAEIDGILRGERIKQAGNTANDILKILNDPSTSVIEVKSVPERCVRDGLDPGRSSKFYVQCSLAGCDEVYLAGKDKNGVVTQATIVKTDDLPRGHRRKWTPRNCIKSLDEVLDLILMEFAEKDDLSTLRIEWQPGQRPSFVELSDKSDDYADKPLSDDFEYYLRQFSPHTVLSTVKNNAKIAHSSQSLKRAHEEGEVEKRKKIALE